jgi:hypothetical protein
METIKTKRFITSNSGKKTDVILDIKTYEKILDDLEELYIIREYDKAKRKTDSEIKAGNFVTLKDYAKRRKLKGARKLAK